MVDREREAHEVISQNGFEKISFFGGDISLLLSNSISSTSSCGDGRVWTGLYIEREWIDKDISGKYFSNT